MGDEELPKLKKTKTKKTFSHQFDAAMVETRMIDALVTADGWTLADFINSPAWLRQIYTRHATAACMEMQKIEAVEGTIKPSEHT